MSKGQTVCYIRISSVDQNEARQVEALAQFNPDKTFIDKASGKDTDRPQLTAAMSHLREGDRFVIMSMDRLSRSLQDLLSLVKQLTSRGVRVEFVKESLAFTGKDDSMSQLLLSIFGSFSEFERCTIRERQAQGIAIRKAKGLYKGRQHALTPAQQSELRTAAAAGISKTELAQRFSITRQTVYRYLTTQAV